MRLLIAVMRAGRAAARQSPNTFYLVCRAQGIARVEKQEAVIPMLRLAEMNLTVAYRLEQPAVGFASALKWTSEAASVLCDAA